MGRLHPQPCHRSRTDVGIDDRRSRQRPTPATNPADAGPLSTDCNCSTVNIETAPPTAADRTGTTYEVAGMTCGGCASSVSTSIGKLDGVTSVDVDVTTGTVTVHGTT
ncbi:heavy-metal-associated domain-containing protein [Kribbella sp. NPDC051718]|uniref:heavy-metal-associated domain-containing protein n=1 Tax=Kribbella sp. NPDC051718 TaxID=3155168 RepID=UPI00344A9DD9